MKIVFRAKFAGLLAALGLVVALPIVAPSPAGAQHSATYGFLNGVRERDFAAVQALVEQPGSTVINVRERGTGEGALHIVTRRRDTQWLLYLLRARANPNIRDNDGNTPMHIAAQIGYGDGIRWLNVVEADVNATNNRGETPLIMAVQQRNADIVRQLIEAGADPDIADGVVGMSARDYATRDSRSAAILALLDRAEPAQPERQTVGPVAE